MISNELSTIQFKDGQRAEIALAMASFQGEITVIETPVVRPEMPGDWRRTLNLPGSANVSGLRPMPVPAELQRLIDAAHRPGP